MHNLCMTWKHVLNAVCSPQTYLLWNIIPHVTDKRQKEIKEKGKKRVNSGECNIWKRHLILQHDSPECSKAKHKILKQHSEKMSRNTIGT